VNTLRLHFIHQFAVKSALATCADVLTYRQAGLSGDAVMRANMLRRVGQKIVRLAFGVLAAAVLLLPAAVRAEDPLQITLDQASIIKLPEKVSTIIIGNPMIADVTVQSGGLVVVTGKGFGSTNMIALDRTGAVLSERSIVVGGPNGQTVQLFRGTQRETYSCTPDCERRITLGDSADYFTSTMGQSDARNGSAAGNAAGGGGASTTKAPAR
jgi:Flp pilus assembly secretin CpaC